MATAAERKRRQRERMNAAAQEAPPEEWSEALCLHILSSPAWRGTPTGEKAWHRLAEIQGYPLTQTERDRHAEDSEDSDNRDLFESETSEAPAPQEPQEAAPEPERPKPRFEKTQHQLLDGKERRTVDAYRVSVSGIEVGMVWKDPRNATWYAVGADDPGYVLKRSLKRGDATDQIVAHAARKGWI